MIPGNESKDISSYDLYLQKKEPVTSECLALLDKRLTLLEETVGSQPNHCRVLSVATDKQPLIDAVQVLDNRKYTLNPEHLSHIEGRLAALVTKLNALNEQKEKVNSAVKVSQVAKIFNSLEDRAGIVNILPDVYERLLDLKELHLMSSEWKSRAAEISADQGNTETLLVENRKLLSSTQSLLSSGLQGVDDKLEELNR